MKPVIVLAVLAALVSAVAFSSQSRAEPRLPNPRLAQPEDIGRAVGALPGIAQENLPALAISGSIAASNTYANASYATAGVGLRNLGVGNIALSGVVTPVKAAFLYWAVITSGAVTSVNTSVTVERIAPLPANQSTGAQPATGASAVVNGTVIGTSQTSTGWGTNTTFTAFRAAVPVNVASGSGLYRVTLKAGGSGDTSGTNPFFPSTLKFPLMEGASLVVVGSGNKTVALYDTGLAATVFGTKAGLSYSLKVPTAASGYAAGTFDSIGANGKTEMANYLPDYQALNLVIDAKVTTVNGQVVAGPGSNTGDSDWNGNAGAPLPQLWDDTSHGFVKPSSGGAAVTVAITGAPQGSANQHQTDTLVTIANVVGFY